MKDQVFDSKTLDEVVEVDGFKMVMVMLEMINLRCYNSKKYRHIIANFKLKTGKDDKKNFVEAKESEDSTLLLTCNGKEEKNSKFWYLD